MGNNFGRLDPKEHGFGRIPSEYDNRDYNLRAFMPRGILKTTFITHKLWQFWGTTLDQELTNHCVGMAMAHFGINLPINTKYTKEDAHDFYYKCKVEDGMPDEENGTYIRSAVKVLKDEGRINTYAFARDMETIKWWLLNRGPLIVGTIWTVGMLTPDEKYKIYSSGDIVGGHAYIINEWTFDDYLGIVNSWGQNWGKEGKAYMHVDEFAKIFYYDGEAVTALELPHESKKCVGGGRWFNNVVKILMR